MRQLTAESAGSLDVGRLFGAKRDPANRPRILHTGQPHIEPKDTLRHDPPDGSDENGSNSGVKWPSTVNDGLKEMVPRTSATFP